MFYGLFYCRLIQNVTWHLSYYVQSVSGPGPLNDMHGHSSMKYIYKILQSYQYYLAILCTIQLSCYFPHSHRRQHPIAASPDLSGVSAERPHSGANGRHITGRHGGQRKEESQPAVWPQHPGELSGQLQVRAPAEGAWGGGAEPPPLEAVNERWEQRGSAELKVLMLAVRSRCSCVWLRSALRIEVAMCCWVACFVFGRVCSRRTEASRVLPASARTIHF